jgi:hypothetical protein
MTFRAYFWPLCVALAISAQAVAVPSIIERNYQAARARYQANPAKDEAAWQFGRACFDRAEYSQDDEEHAKLAREGMAACQALIDRDPHSAAGHYYLAMNLAQLARTKKLGALPLLSQMEKQWEAAYAINQTIDFAGPDRNLGLLYRDAPGWPISLGSKEKARQHLVRAVELSPDSPEDRLNLIETYLKWDEPDLAAREAAKFRALLPGLRKNFTGDYWNESWKDWNQRWIKVQLQLQSEQPAPASNDRK